MDVRDVAIGEAIMSARHQLRADAVHSIRLAFPTDQSLPASRPTGTRSLCTSTLETMTLAEVTPRVCSSENGFRECLGESKLRLRRLTLRLSVSRDEEHVRLEMVRGAFVLDVGART